MQTRLGRLGTGQKDMGRRPRLHWPQDPFTWGQEERPHQQAPAHTPNSLIPKPLSYSLFVECILLLEKHSNGGKKLFAFTGQDHI